MTTRTLILGGGFGGLTVASALRQRLGAEHEVVLVDRSETFYMGLRKLWVLVGSATLDEGRRPLSALRDRGVRVVRASVTAIDPVGRRVETDEGVLEGDFVVVALGAEPALDRVPGASEHAFNLYDAASVEAAADRISGMESGRIVVTIAGLPYKCPPAPYEAIMLLDDHLRSKGVRDRIELTLTTLQPMLLPNAGPEGARWMAEELTRRGIRHEVGRKVERVEDGRIVFQDAELAFDLALIAPPHRVPSVVRESPLVDEGGWVSVNRETLATRFPRVYAIGDVTNIPLANQMPLPKAGVFAEAHGRRVAAGIVAEIAGEPAPAPFDGRGYCFVELGGDLAAKVQGDFFAAPSPALQISEPTRAGLEAKRDFESSRLQGWFQ